MTGMFGRWTAYIWRMDSHTQQKFHQKNINALLHLYIHWNQHCYKSITASLVLNANALPFDARKWIVLLDAAAFVPTSRLDLSKWHPDFVTVSFYKMFGLPTGVGALIARKEAMAILSPVSLKWTTTTFFRYRTFQFYIKLFFSFLFFFSLLVSTHFIHSYISFFLFICHLFLIIFFKILSEVILGRRTSRHSSSERKFPRTTFGSRRKIWSRDSQFPRNNGIKCIPFGKWFVYIIVWNT